MKRSSICVLFTILAGGAAHAERASYSFEAFDETPRFMFYVQKQLGVPGRKSDAPSFGLSIERQVPGSLGADSSFQRSPTVRMFDLQFAPFDGGALRLNGFQLGGKASHALGYEGSYGEEESWSWSNPWLWAGAGLGAALALSCATDNWPCEGSNYSGRGGYRVPGE
jgi:hypothetical protein